MEIDEHVRAAALELDFILAPTGDFAPGPDHRVTIEKQAATSEQGVSFSGLVKTGEHSRRHDGPS